MEVLSTIRVRPSKIEHLGLVTGPLSIIDNTTANFTPAGAVLFFSPPSKPDTTGEPLLPIKLISSLSACLDSFPQFAGQLHFIDPSDGRFPLYQRRHGRLAITWGPPDQIEIPGVQFVKATSTRPLPSILEPATKAASGLHVSPTPDSSAFFPPASTHPLALDGLRPSATDIPATIIQHTTYPCGSVSLSIKISHPLSDAQTLFTFMKSWAAMHRSKFGTEAMQDPVQHSLPSLSLLDTTAKGDLNSTSGPDPNLLSISRSLPLSRFSWWQTSPPGCPWKSAAERIPEELQPHVNDDGDPLPWGEWDIGKKIEYRSIHLSSEQISRLFREATIDKETSPSVTCHTAILAHIWRLIARARQAAFCHTASSNPTNSDNDEASEDTHMHLTLGLRGRVPNTTSATLGSPILNSTITTNLSSMLSCPLSATASLIQRNIAQFTPDKLGALLHGMAYDVCPWRIWHAFLGAKRLLVTSWVRSGGWEVDFTGHGEGGEGRSQALQYVLPYMPPCEGLCIVIESPGDKKKDKGGKWWSDGVDVICYLDKETWREMLEHRMEEM